MLYPCVMVMIRVVDNIILNTCRKIFFLRRMIINVQAVDKTARLWQIY
jgi:hypothetical protein